LNSAAAPSRILVRGVNWLGDAVMTTPALQRLRERFPKAHITLLTHQKLADLWPHHPSLDRVLTLAPGEKPWTLARRLRAENFDLALVLPNSPRSALEIWLARIPRRLGLARPWRNWLLTHPVPPRPGHLEMHKRSDSEIQHATRNTQHAALRVSHFTFQGPTLTHHIHSYLHLTAALGANSDPLPPLLTVTPDELQATASKFGLPSSTAPTAPVFALNSGAEYGPAKRWPIDRFIEAALQIQKQTNCTWLILGGASDLPLATQIHSALLATPKQSEGRVAASQTEHCALCTLHSALLLAGRTSLRELMALLKLSRVLLTNDTGPMHVAGALGIPVVVPFGSTSPELTAPGLPGDPRHHILTASAPCSPCFRRSCPIDFRCMTSIPVSSVIDAVLQSTQS
jgi:heptosyltransferase-2